MNDNVTSSKGYRYEVLLKAIDFFTQRFSLEQIGYYAFEFTNEILTVHSAALFIREENNYVLKNSRLYDINHYQVPCSQALDEIPVLHGDIIVHQLERFFSKEVIETFSIKMVIPLIIDKFLYGFMVLNGKILSEFDEDDRVIASTLSKLFGNSLGNSRQLDELALKNKQLDQKIFNLFAINQSAKSLLSEVDLDRLYALATDIFSEITCSKVTSFGVYDAISDCIKVLGYRNVSNYSTVFTEIHLYETTYHSGRVVLDFTKDLEIIKSLFKNWEEFYLLDTKYIILLVKDKILGVVTLSEAVNDRLYDEATFELIETLASFTHIAISNALLFKKLMAQNDKVERKFNILSTLNQIMQNVNQGVSIEELSRLTLKVLSFNFGVKKAFFAYRTPEGYSVSQVIGLQMTDEVFGLKDTWEKACQGEMILDFKEGTLNDYFENDIVSQIGTSNCLVIAPIGNANTYDYELTNPKGFLVVLETKDSLKEEEILLIDTITKNISPVIHQMDLNECLKKDYRIDPLREFVKAIELKFAEREEYTLEFYLYYKIVNRSPFEKTEELLIDEEECYLVDNFIFVLTYDNDISDKLFCPMPRLERIEELLQFDYLNFYEEYKNSL